MFIGASTKFIKTSKNFSRRQIIQWISAQTVLSRLTLAGLSGQTAAAEQENKTSPAQVNRLLAILVNTPHNKILETLAAKIKEGINHQDLLAALALAGVNHIEPYPIVGFKYHAVMMLSAIHNTVIHSPANERWLPLLWAADVFKREQRNDTYEGDWTLPSNNAARASPEFNRQRTAPQNAFKQAMDNWDAQAADVAIIRLINKTSFNAVFEYLFYYGARDFRNIGHKIITVSNSHRLLVQLGEQFAEPILRSTIYALQNHTGYPNPANSDLSADQPWRKNQAFARQFPKHWQRGKTDHQATTALLSSLRNDNYSTASLVAVDLLKKGIDPQMLWDAAILSAGELIMRVSGIISVHANTSVNAMHYAYLHTQNDNSKRLLLLQALAFITLFRDLLKGEQRSLNIDSFAPLSTTTQDEQRYTEVFENISDNRETAARKILHMLNQGASVAPIMTLGRHYTVYHNTGYHDYKFTEAAFENASRLSSRWRARYISASVFYLNGSKDKVNNVVLQAKNLIS